MPWWLFNYFWLLHCHWSLFAIILCLKVCYVLPNNWHRSSINSFAPQCESSNKLRTHAMFTCVKIKSLELYVWYLISDSRCWLFMFGDGRAACFGTQFQSQNVVLLSKKNFRSAMTSWVMTSWVPSISSFLPPKHWSMQVNYKSLQTQHIICQWEGDNAWI